MPRCYINGISSISAQSEQIFNPEELRELDSHIVTAREEDYKSVIKPMMLRRMSQAVKMGLFCSKKALEDANIEMPDAIITGTGQGCLQDTEKFLENMLTSEEGLLAPTSFIQSTHNTVGGQIALDLKCTAYNMTYTQNSGSFESALLDAILQLGSASAANILVGGVDEISPKFSGFPELDGQVKDGPIKSSNLLDSRTGGSILSEAAAFFVLSSEKGENCYAEVLDVKLLNKIQPENVESNIQEFLKINGIQASDLDLIILGNNGDSRFDHIYKGLQEGVFSGKSQLAYKHLVGENNSISSYALWLAAKIIQQDSLPEAFKLNDVTCREINRVLIYDQYLGKNHGLILLQRP